jgi:pantoate--beta-alanine ligase
VVTKIFGMTQPDRAYFGKKDWQQLQVITRMVQDLNMPIQIIGCETLREADGLAMSSRNARLGADARARAPALFAALTAAARRGADAQALRDCAEQVLAAGFDRVEYIEARDAATLEPPISPDRPLRLLAAAWLDGVRLIDNIAI